MSPDIEWHVGEAAEQETIARTSGRPPSRRGRWVVLIAIGLGVGLGLLYRSIPETPAKPIDPAPTLAIEQSPPAQMLEAAIERDALRLASMNDPDSGVTFDPAPGQMLPAYSDWYAGLQNASGGWGSILALPPYTIFETGTLPNTVTWVKLGQFRNGNIFHHLRFYRWHDDLWNWTLPDPAYWKGPTAAVVTGDAGIIGPIVVGHPIEDALVIDVVFGRFTRAYLNLCESLGCPPRIDAQRLWTPGLTLTLAVLPQQTEATVQERGNATLRIELPSPQIVGYFEDPNTPGDPFTSMAYDTLIDPVVRLASGDYARWETDRGGAVFLRAIAEWQRVRVKEVVQPSEIFFRAPDRPPTFELINTTPQIFFASMLRAGPQIPLSSLWNWSPEDTRFGLLPTAAHLEAESVVYFVEAHYQHTGVIRFLNALGRATSLEEALETGLNVKFEELNRQWLAWIAGE